MEYVNKNLVLAKLKATDNKDAITQLANLLQKQGYVNKDFAQAVLDREKIYPTGLPSGKVNVAIPHTDIKYVNSPAIVFASLEKPIKFKNMADKSQEINVSFIAMLAMKEPHSQVSLLQNLMKLFQNQDLLEKFISLDDNSQLFDQLSNYFKKEA